MQGSQVAALAAEYKGIHAAQGGKALHGACGKVLGGGNSIGQRQLQDEVNAAVQGGCDPVLPRAKGGLTALHKVAADDGDGMGGAPVAGGLEGQQVPPVQGVPFGNNGSDRFTVSFVGDILLDPDFAPMVHAKAKGGVLGKCIDQKIVDHLKSSDIFLINHEFSSGSRGKPLYNKSWTFQAPESSLSILKDMGADIVSLANNHVFDYGEDAFYDTLDNLKKAGIPYIGAGRNIEEAKKGCYFVINGCKVGIVAASRAEKVRFTPISTADTPGVMGTYDNADFLNVIKDARAQCDLLFVYVHWGTENSTALEQAQIKGAREYIDAGADVIVGAHTHCLQGMEFYKNKPIIYSVGNFWFNSKTLDSCVMTFTVDKDMNVQTQILPLLQKGCETRLLTAENERRALFDRVESYEPQGVSISDDGIVTSK